jgi:hypothetical protein
MVDDFQDEIEFLGIESSTAFVRQPAGNGVAERVIRTLKEQLLWVRYFPTVEALRKGLAEFADLYNASWLRERRRIADTASPRLLACHIFAARHVLGCRLLTCTCTTPLALFSPNA